MAARSRSARSSGIRVGRIVAVVALLLMAALYVSPVQKYLRVQRELAQQRTLVHRLEGRNRDLAARAQALTERPAIVRCARARGWVFPGEHGLIVTGLPVAARARGC